MAFDGITVAAVVKECRELLTGSRIYKIAQPEADELQLTLRTKTGQYYLLLSASASRTGGSWISPSPGLSGSCIFISST